MANNYLSERTSLRMQASSTRFFESAMESDVNFKLKMLKEEKLRMMRDRKNFRDNNGN
jgi:energy-coupling factor transporter ATP-binding protein EcfA2